MKIVKKPTVYLHPAKQSALHRGHPWIFPKAIKRQAGNPETGQLVDVCSDESEYLATGIYNEHSLYRVRILTRAFESIHHESIVEIVLQRLRQAASLRRNLGLPNVLTNAYRLFNSEADGLSGLTIDRFNDVCVVSSSAYWVEANKESICAGIQGICPKDRIIWLPQIKALAQDGWESAVQESISDSEQIMEAGIRFQVDFSNTQKTGLFLDQRENHQRISALAQGKRVLDLYTYTGGFALHAAKGGAVAVTAVDSSEQAIILARRNAQLNHIDNIEFIKADARDYLAKAGEYDLVILDPPKLVPSRQHLQRAKNYYRYLHKETIKAMRSGSLLLTCNCSSALSTSEFTELVSQQAMAVGKTIRTLGVYGPASCHPTLTAFPEGQYLTAALFAIF